MLKCYPPRKVPPFETYLSAVYVVVKLSSPSILVLFFHLTKKHDSPSKALFARVFKWPMYFVFPSPSKVPHVWTLGHLKFPMLLLLISLTKQKTRLSYWIVSIAVPLSSPVFLSSFICHSYHLMHFFFTSDIIICTFPSLI